MTVMTLKLTMEDIQLINAFYSVSNVQAKNCLVDGNTITFMVAEGVIGKAIGRQGAHIKELSAKLGKSIEIMPYATNGQEFIGKVLKMYNIPFKTCKVT